MLGYLDKEAGPETLINKVFKTVFYWTIPLYIYIVYTRTLVRSFDIDKAIGCTISPMLTGNGSYESIIYMKASSI